MAGANRVGRSVEGYPSGARNVVLCDWVFDMSAAIRCLERARRARGIAAHSRQRKGSGPALC